MMTDWLTLASNICRPREEKIVTRHDPKPIPTNRFDWSAIDDNTYDGPGCPVGYGATEAEAIADLLDQIDATDTGHDGMPDLGEPGEP
jgi:hypothetical protein